MTSTAGTAPRRTQVERRETAERRLLRAAAELTAEVGPAAMTLAAVGERAGYSRGLASHHFGTKAMLMRRLSESVTEWFQERLDTTLGDADPLVRLDRLVGAYFEMLGDFTPIYRARLMLWADAVARPSSELRPIVVEADQAFREKIVQGVHDARARGLIDTEVDADGVATMLIGMLRGIAMQSLVAPIDLEATLVEVQRILAASLTPAP
ncbi:hypothetical protein BHE97_07810 [Aeromicrobium sp. PE09-221]|uniref:TetR/AcrR family transcriptional regulator n=1 Tax=Actinomycetes TaxID=1760 RepID=UPI000B3EA9DC|nr:MULTISPECIES: TetR/AcrR family transcriptional regulator [Actinomycetes]MCT2138638.1 TetR/AcrR family transcriptional regulator [Dietzia cinnamea]OUZ10253.1 hypothetical protein BHE97_07810 [Aeromicrobium sp. PE09-221]